jgi:hypothetical protein
MPTYDNGVMVSRPPAEAITVLSTEPLPSRARLFVKITAADRVAKAHATDEVDGVAEYAVGFSGDDFADDAVGVATSGFPLVRILHDVTAGDRLRPAIDNSGYADVAPADQRACAIAKTSASAGSAFPFVRAQLLRRSQGALRGVPLTENGDEIAGTNDGNLPDLTATAIAITDNTTGAADITDPATLAAIINPDLSAWNGTVDPSAAQATAINAAITSLKNAVASMAGVINQLRADNVALRAGVREVATKVNTLAA